MGGRALEVNGKLRRGERLLEAVRKMDRSASGHYLEVGGKLLGWRAGGARGVHLAARLSGCDHETRAGHGHPHRSRGGATRRGGPVPLLSCMGWRVSMPRRVCGRPRAWPAPGAVRRGVLPSVCKARGLRDAWRARNAQSRLTGPMRTARHDALANCLKLRLVRLVRLVRLLPLLHLTWRSCRHADGALGRRVEGGARQLRT